MMLQFIDLRGQTNTGFTFLDTSIQAIVSYNGENCWDSWEDFENNYKNCMSNEDGTIDLCHVKLLNRYKNLCPEWVFKNPENNKINSKVFSYQDINDGNTFDVTFSELLDRVNAMCVEHNCTHDEIEIGANYKQYLFIFYRGD